MINIGCKIFRGSRNRFEYPAQFAWLALGFPLDMDISYFAQFSRHKIAFRAEYRRNTKYP